MPVWLHVDPRNGVPLYLQVVDGVQRALDLGILRPGEALPTVRQLATELTIAPNTIVKAYAELERRGLIDSRAGAGTTVRADLDATLRRRAVARLQQRLRELVHDATALGIDGETLRAWFAAEVRQVATTAGGATTAGHGQEGDPGADGHTLVPSGHDRH